LTANVPSSKQSSYSIFLSHAMTDAELVKSIARALPAEGLRGFAATYHLPATREWLPELEAELHGCDALAAILTPAFRSSEWTDQEVGFALASGRRIVPLLASGVSLPHGFLQRFQGLPIGGRTPRGIARLIFDTLFAQPDEQPRLLDTVLTKLQTERDQSRIDIWVRRLERATDLDPASLRRVEHALATNSMVRNNANIASRVRTIITRQLTKNGSQE
jgi:hypothetical protein